MTAAQPSISSSPRRILIFGGTFDPPHLAHARLPAMAARQLDCGEIIYVPAAISPLKQKTPPTAKEHRIAMLLLAMANVPHARISTIELDREGVSYTIDTLRALQNELNIAESSAAQFHLLIGADQALDFHRWKAWKEILVLATPAVMLRPPWDASTFEAQLRARYSEVEADCWKKWTLHLPTINISATEIREKLKHRQSVTGLLDPAVEKYIAANRLYE